MRDPVATMLGAIASDPADDAAWLALADALEDADRPREAEVARLRERLRRLERDDPERPAAERRMQGLLAQGVRPVGPSLTLTLPHGAGMEFRLIPPGAFWMGSPPDEPGRRPTESLPRRVGIDRGFWLATTLLTEAQARDGGSSLPALIAYRGLRSREFSAHWGRPVRLPTEEEWEYACRAGTTSACHGGDLLSLPLVGWCSYGEHASRRARTKPVGSYAPNAWGLYDMHGSLWEWTSRSGGSGFLFKQTRGGCFRALPTMCRSASRNLARVTAEPRPR